MSGISPAVVVFLTTCMILGSAGVTEAQEAEGRAPTSISAGTTPPEFLTGPVSDAGLQPAGEPQRSSTVAHTAVFGAPRASSHAPAQRQVAVEGVEPDTWQEEYSGHVNEVLHGGTSPSQRGTVSDWCRQRLPHTESVTAAPGRLKASAKNFINEHTLPPEQDYDIDIFDQRPFFVESLQAVTTVRPLDENPDDAQAANSPAISQLRTDIRAIRPTLEYAMRNIDAGQLPEGFSEKLDQGDYIPRQSSPAVLQWAPTNLYHYPLYFEDPALERYGHTYHPIVQPFASAGRFATQLVGIPYQMTLHPVHSKEYTLGYYRPGECAPKKHYQIPFNEEAAIMQAAAMAGFFLIFP